MLLKLTILRNTYPPTRILFALGSTGSVLTARPVATFYDLLLDIDEIVPLETAGTTWPLEDYIVEVKSGSSSGSVYECLLFQKLRDVLKDGDEVQIRPLSSEELLERERSKRIQYTGVRRLVDGHQNGSVWETDHQRPDLNIPPTNGLLEAAPNVQSIPEQLSLLWHLDDDDDDVGGTEAVESISRGRIVVRGVFDDADEDGQNAETADMSTSEDLEGEAPQPASSLNTLKHKTSDKEKVQSNTQAGAKRKWTQARESDGEEVFEGFSADDQKPKRRRTHKAKLPESEVDSSEDSYSTTSSDISDTTSSSGSDTTSSDGSDSISTSDSDSESSSNSDTDSTSDSSSSASDEENAKQARSRRRPFAKVSLSTFEAPSSKQSIPSATPPRQGTNTTHNNNRRAKLRKRLKALKANGILPSNADLQDLKAYEENHFEDNSLVQDADRVDKDIDLAREKVLAQLEQHVDSHTKSTSTDEPMEVSQRHSENDQAIDNSQAGADLETPASQVKRPKLDIASSRRMLFGSLGLRTPKTPADEEALREKLSQSVRTISKKTPSATDTHGDVSLQPLDNHDRSWQNKLVLSAVECEREGLLLPPPPFPFEQGWHKLPRNGKKADKRKSRAQEQYYHGYDEGDSLQMVEDLSHDAQYDGWSEQPQNNQCPLKSEASNSVPDDDIPMPPDYEDLSALNVHEIKRDCIIAYKELFVDDSTNFQPEISPYRVARVVEVQDNNIIRVLLAKKDRIRHAFDEVTGQRIYSKFEIPGDLDGVDDGIREIIISDLIQPKLVLASPVQVPDSVHGSALELLDNSAQAESDPSAFIPESEIQHQHSVNLLRTSTQTSSAPESSQGDDKLLMPISYPEDSIVIKGPQIEVVPTAETLITDETTSGTDRVVYPSLPLAEIDFSSKSTGNKSSHQDAQRLPQHPSLLDQSTEEKPNMDDLIEAEAGTQTTGKDGSQNNDAQVPLTLSQDVGSVRDRENGEGNQESASFLGVPGYDGLDSSYQDHENVEDLETSFTTSRQLSSAVKTRSQSKEPSTKSITLSSRIRTRGRKKRATVKNSQLSNSSQKSLEQFPCLLDSGDLQNSNGANYLSPSDEQTEEDTITVDTVSQYESVPSSGSKRKIRSQKR